MHYKGSRDRPITNENEDQFNLKNYYRGLQKFIEGCETPITIAIQGDWGSGKTSMMNSVQNRLDKQRHIFITFNTWQYSQFKQEDQLSIAMLYAITDTVEKNLNPKDRAASKLSGILKNIIDSLHIKASLGHEAVGSLELDEKISKLLGMDDGDTLYTSLSLFRKSFEKAVNNITKVKKDGSREKKVVIFIDDLDRLPPERAVELLEVIKVFLDVEGCVFILGIDYEVVRLGVMQKYGDGLLFDKGKSFFDKMIQLPFQIPVQFYDMGNLLRDCFSRIGIKVSEESAIYDVVRHGVGTNPRTVKRLLNSFELNRDILQVKGNDERSNLFLLAIICIQLYDEKLYQYLLNTKEWKLVDTVTIFNYTPENKEYPSYADLVRQKLKLSHQQDEQYNYARTQALLELLNKTIHSGDQPIEDSFDPFIRLLEQSQVTSANTSTITERTKLLDFTEKTDIKPYVIKGVRINNQESMAVGNFTYALITILETVIPEDRFYSFIHDKAKTQQSKLPDRLFAKIRPDDNESSTYSGDNMRSVKTIHGNEIVLHYGRDDLQRYLFSFLKAFDLNPHLQLIIEDINPS